MSLRLSLVLCWTLLRVSCVFAQSVSLSPEDQIVWREHHEEIVANAAFPADDSFVRIVTKYETSKRMIEPLRKYCRDKEARKYLCNYKQYDSFDGRVIEKARIDSAYQDSIDALLWELNPEITGAVVCTALQYADILRLKRNKTEALENLALMLARELRHNPCMFIARQEMDSLMKILTRSQIETVLTEKNARLVFDRAENAWTAVRTAGLSSELDSAQSMQSAIHYYNRESFIRAYYVGHSDLIANNLSDLYRNKPMLIRIYEGLWQKKRVQKKYEKKVGEEYAW